MGGCFWGDCVGLWPGRYRVPHLVSHIPSQPQEGWKPQRFGWEFPVSSSGAQQIRGLFRGDNGTGIVPAQPPKDTPAREPQQPQGRGPGWNYQDTAGAQSSIFGDNFPLNPTTIPDPSLSPQPQNPGPA